MTALSNFEKVTNGLLRMYKEESEENIWLQTVTPKRNQLAAALLEVRCLFGSKTKRDSTVCDNRLYAL